MLWFITSASALSSASTVALTPCGPNSFRVRVSTALSPAGLQTFKGLEATLAAEGLSELPGAFVGCDEATIELSSSATTKARSGNLEVTLTSTGVTFSRADNGVLLTTATATFTPPPSLAASCTSGDWAAGSDLGSPANMTIAAAVEWCNAESACIGFTTRGTADVCAATTTADTRMHQIYFKGVGATATSDHAWLRWSKPLEGGYLQAGLDFVAAFKDERVYGCICLISNDPEQLSIAQRPAEPP